ncbi:hypothetical protein MFIFM68171_07632 [Madurella fahalii]|uniref:Uncharacterized protein n=1 Tax=Madurella fahalii TaxID=1157608 RepID=A0ABQ0GI24_9PEZI
MKTSSAAVLLSGFLVALAQGASFQSLSGETDVSWYDPVRDITCTGHNDGTITCQQGQVDAPAELTRTTFMATQDDGFDATRPSLHSSTTTTTTHQPLQEDDKFDEVTDTVSEGPGRIPRAEEGAQEAQMTCGASGVTPSLECFIHCFAMGYCKSHCDDGNVCQCSCKDESERSLLVCSQTSCW